MRWITEVDSIPQAAPQARTVMISAGHSDTDPGAIAHGYSEAELVCEFRTLVSRALAKRGIRHLTDGEGATNLPLREAVDIARRADIAIEFHCNAGGPRASGVETLSRPEHYRLGELLCAVTADVLGIPNRGAKPEDAGPHSRLAFVSAGGGLILELCFITSKHDLASFLAGQRVLADEIARVIAEFARTP